MYHNRLRIEIGDIKGVFDLDALAALILVVQYLPLPFSSAVRGAGTVQRVQDEFTASPALPREEVLKQAKVQDWFSAGPASA